MKVAVKYFTDFKEEEKIKKIEKGDWIDLRAAEDITIKQFEFKLIPLGVGFILPDDYEALIVPRSSTYKKYGIIQTNSIGVIDNSYSGDNDQWMMPVIAMRDTEIKKGDRICQFRIQKRMDTPEFVEVKRLREVSRGGFGSTGVK